MKPLDPDQESLLRLWIEKADADLEAAQQLAPQAANRLRIREIVGFHCQQAVEKYLKALLTYYQIEFPKTHDIEKLLQLVGLANIGVTNSLRSAAWLTPFGADIRYPGDLPDMLPGDETVAIETARAAREAALRLLDAD